MIKNKSIYIKNIYYMLSYAYQSLRQAEFRDIELETFDNIHDLFSEILSTGIAYQIKHGLSKEYVEITEPLRTLRGKIDLTETLRKQTLRNKQCVCCHDEYSENSYMNRILKTTSMLLIRLGQQDLKTKNKLKKVMTYFSVVEELDPLTINWSTLRYHRNNSRYQMLINICYLVINGLLLTTDNGKRKMASFIDDQQMSRLYEKFILRYFQNEHPKYHAASRQIAWDTTGKLDMLPTMQSDIMLRFGEQTIIIDAKYYSKSMQVQYEKRTIHSNNLYQIFTYVKNEDKQHTGKVTGVVLYAKTDEEIVPDNQYILGGSKFIITTLDLKKDFTAIKQQLDSIVTSIFE